MKFPWTRRNGDIHGVPSRIVTSLEPAGRLLASVGKDGHGVGMKLPFRAFVGFFAKDVCRAQSVGGRHFSCRIILENLLADVSVALGLGMLDDGFLRSTCLIVGGKD